MRTIRLNLLLLFLTITVTAGEHVISDTIFLFSPMAGIIRHEVNFSLSGSSQRLTLKEDGTLYGVYTMYIKKQFMIGNLLHCSRLSESNENGSLIFGHYYFNKDKKLQPTLGLSVEHILINSEIIGEEIEPLISLNVHNEVWATFPTAGIAYKNSFFANRVNFQITPFVGYFNEQVHTRVTSPGMKIAGRNQNGFTSNSSVNLDYASVGAKLIMRLFHWINIDTKFYVRFRQNEKSLYTFRTRADFYLTRRLGLSIKGDYLKDIYETTRFLFFGPSFIF